MADSFISSTRMDQRGLLSWTGALCALSFILLVSPAGAGAQDGALTPPHRTLEDAQLVRVALLLPLSAPRQEERDEAASMLEAAQLALFGADADRLVLIPKDTGGTADGARTQAREALAEGADVILGPLSPDAARAAAAETAAAGKLAIAFSDDPTAAESGAYVLGVTPEEEVRRVIGYAARRGRRVAFATLTADNALGRRVRDAAERAARVSASFLVAWESYPAGGDAASLESAVLRLARYEARRDAERNGRGDDFELPYDAVLVPEGGETLLTLAPLLPYYEVDPALVRLLGTSAWREDEVAREPSLAGAWLAALDEDAGAAFTAAYEAAYGKTPGRRAALAYDAVLAVASLTRGLGAAGLTDEGLQRATGFRGAQGLFRFNESRVAEHALAVYEVRDGAFVRIERAPQTFPRR